MEATQLSLLSLVQVNFPLSAITPSVSHTLYKYPLHLSSIPVQDLFTLTSPSSPTPPREGEKRSNLIILDNFVQTIQVAEKEV